MSKILYIDDIDDYTFRLSSPRGENIVVHNKDFFARNQLPMEKSPHGLVTIRSFDENLFVCTAKQPSEIALNGVVYEEAWVTAVVFNCMMNNDDCSHLYISTTTTELPVTTTTTEIL